MKIALYCLSILLITNSIFSQSFTLPNLPYAYGDYAPQIDALTMEIHHKKHHQAYINNLNTAVKGTKMETQSLIDLMFYASFRSDAVRNNAGGHYNHSLFWEILAPSASQGVISDELSAAINRDYGTMDSLKKLISAAAVTRFGSGWAWLIVTPEKKLMVTSTANQDNPIMDITKDRGIPIVGIDVWEHAYYLNYQNKRMDYLSSIWTLIDWGAVSKKYSLAINDSLLIELEKDNWPAMKDFHKTMAQTFHPSEKGDLIPLRNRSGELLAKAILLKESLPPKSFDANLIQKGLQNLEEKCNEVNVLVEKNAKDAVLIKKIREAHDLFHVVQGLCHD